MANKLKIGDYVKSTAIGYFSILHEYKGIITKDVDGNYHFSVLVFFEDGNPISPRKFRFAKSSAMLVE